MITKDLVPISGIRSFAIMESSVGGRSGGFGWHARGMGRPRRVAVKRVIAAASLRVPAKPVIGAASLCAAVALAGCSASSPAADPPASATARSAPHSAASSGARSAASSSPEAAAFSFTVAGNHPVAPNGSQDTSAQAAGAGCDTAKLASDHALGLRIARGFGLAGFSVGADLLRHFLRGTGTGVAYRAGTPISEQAQASTAFQAVNDEVQAEILGQLKAGRTHVRLSAAQLPTVAFESRASDLYWGFRGTQGLTVTGGGHRAHGRYTGTLSYVIRDSYGFPVGDILDGFGPPMRYLQTACGAPQHRGGARWFPDTITVTVPFSHPA
jgi:hypothetical protein